MRAKIRSRSGRRGSTLVLFTLMLPTLLIPLVGLGIDATMCYIVQAKLGAAVDGAALGAGRLLGTAAVPAEIANEFLLANFKANGTTMGFWGANTLNKTITFTPGITKTIAVDANVRVPLLFARLFGQPYATVSASATAARTDSRIMLVIDRSTSMGSGPMAAAVAKAQSFTRSFTPGTDEVGLVVFGGSAIVAYPNTRPWTATIGVTGGPDTNFAQTVTPANNMLTQLGYIASGSYTGTAEALSLAYIELQKAHMRDTGGGADPRLNSIVFFTDGAPTAMSLYLNDPAENFALVAAQRVIEAGSTCTHKLDNPPVIAAQMRGWLGSYGAGSGNNWARSMSIDTDPAKTVQRYLQNPNDDEAALYVATPLAGCASAPWGNSPSPSALMDPAGDLHFLPHSDMWGNAINNTNYTNSHFVDASGNTVSPNPTYPGTVGTALDRDITHWTTGALKDYHFRLAAWNAADSAGLRIRTDANRNIAGGRADSQAMAFTIYTIGYLGSGGLDDGLLKRIANDTTSTSYVASQGTGLYIPAANQAQLDAAFQKVAAMILRLSR